MDNDRIQDLEKKVDRLQRIIEQRMELVNAIQAYINDQIYCTGCGEEIQFCEQCQTCDAPDGDCFDYHTFGSCAKCLGCEEEEEDTSDQVDAMAYALHSLMKQPLSSLSIDSTRDSLEGPIGRMVIVKGREDRYGMFGSQTKPSIAWMDGTEPNKRK